MAESNFIFLSKTLIAGAVGGTALTLSGHPLDTIKVNIQTMQQVNGKMQYSGGFDCAKKIIKTNGFKGLYAGLAPPLTCISLMFSARFFGFALGKKLQQTEDNKKLTPKQVFIAGLFAGATSCIITAPVERIKCILQSQNNLAVKQFIGPIDCMKKLYRQQGLRTLFRGYPVTIVRDCPCLAIYYLTYELTNQKLNNVLESRNVNTTNLKPFIILLSGAIAGWSYWIPYGIPIDVIKSRLQSTVSLSKSSRSILLELLQKEGVRGLYRGTGPVLVRAPIANAFQFLGYESAMAFLNYLF